MGLLFFVVFWALAKPWITSNLLSSIMVLARLKKNSMFYMGNKVELGVWGHYCEPLNGGPGGNPLEYLQYYLEIMKLKLSFCYIYIYLIKKCYCTIPNWEYTVTVIFVVVSSWFKNEKGKCCETVTLNHSESLRIN